MVEVQSIGIVLKSRIVFLIKTFVGTHLCCPLGENMKIAIVGATGEVGRMVLTCLQEFDIKFNELDLYASLYSEGTKIDFKGKTYKVIGLIPESLKKGYDYVFFTAGGTISKEYAPVAVEYGATVIDNSSVFRQVEHIPLVVPEVNGQTIKGYQGIIANPNCSTIQLVLLLKPLNDFKKIKKVVVTTMQAVSGAGYKGIVELEVQRSRESRKYIFPKIIDLNVIPQIGDFETQYCFEEIKMTLETRKILNIPDYNLVATTVRVPVKYGHSESIYIEFEEKVNLDEIKQILSKSEAVKYEDDYITPLEIGDSNLSHVSRLRYAGDQSSILLWNVANNVRLGAATNAVKILKWIMDNG